MRIGKLNLLITLGVVLVLVVGGIYLFWNGREASPISGSENIVHMDMGITYLSITSDYARSSGLDIERGAVVTDVSPGSQADQAGIRPGDIILSLNGVEPGEHAPLLGMMMGCPAGEPMTLEVLSDGQVRSVTLYDD